MRILGILLRIVAVLGAVMTVLAGCNTAGTGGQEQKMKALTDKVSRLEQAIADLQVALVNHDLVLYEKRNKACSSFCDGCLEECEKEKREYVDRLPPDLVKTYRAWEKAYNKATLKQHEMKMEKVRQASTTGPDGSISLPLSADTKVKLEIKGDWLKYREGK